MESRSKKQQKSSDDEGEAPAKHKHLEKQQITLRDGNVAYDIERPLFNTDACIELTKLKEEFTRKLMAAPEEVKSLPAPRFLKD